MCHTQDTGSHTQDQDHSQVKGQAVYLYPHEYSYISEVNFECHRKVKQNENLFHVQDSGSMFKDTTRCQRSVRGPLGAFVTYCNIFCSDKQFTGISMLQVRRGNRDNCGISVHIFP